MKVVAFNGSARKDGNTAILGGYNDNGGFGAAWVFVAPATTTHDFNSDCLSDIAWRDSNSGTVAGWLMNGLQTQQTGAYGTVAGNWTIVGQRTQAGWKRRRRRHQLGHRWHW